MQGWRELFIVGEERKIRSLDTAERCAVRSNDGTRCTRDAGHEPGGCYFGGRTMESDLQEDR